MATQLATPLSFLKSTWEILGDSVTQAIQEFFITGKLLKSLNTTWIVLVPKCPNPSTMMQFRPNSCCNLLYKSITKIIANILQFCLPRMISKNQCAFI